MLSLTGTSMRPSGDPLTTAHTRRYKRSAKPSKARRQNRPARDDGRDPAACRGRHAVRRPHLRREPFCPRGLRRLDHTVCADLRCADARGNFLYSSPAVPPATQRRNMSSVRALGEIAARRSILQVAAHAVNAAGVIRSPLAVAAWPGVAGTARFMRKLITVIFFRPRRREVGTPLHSWSRSRGPDYLAKICWRGDPA